MTDRLERALRQTTQSKYTIDELIEAIGLTFGDMRKEFHAEIDALRAEIETLKQERKK